MYKHNQTRVHKNALSGGIFMSHLKAEQYLASYNNFHIQDTSKCFANEKPGNQQRY